MCGKSSRGHDQRFYPRSGQQRQVSTEACKRYVSARFCTVCRRQSHLSSGRNTVLRRTVDLSKLIHLSPILPGARLLQPGRALASSMWRKDMVFPESSSRPRLAIELVHSPDHNSPWDRRVSQGVVNSQALLFNSKIPMSYTLHPMSETCSCLFLTNSMPSSLTRHRLAIASVGSQTGK